MKSYQVMSMIQTICGFCGSVLELHLPVSLPWLVALELGGRPLGTSFACLYSPVSSSCFTWINNFLFDPQLLKDSCLEWLPAPMMLMQSWWQLGQLLGSLWFWPSLPSKPNGTLQDVEVRESFDHFLSHLKSNFRSFVVHADNFVDLWNIFCLHTHKQVSKRSQAIHAKY